LQETDDKGRPLHNNVEDLFETKPQESGWLMLARMGGKKVAYHARRY
jgi:hypothetical protein